MDEIKLTYMYLDQLRAQQDALEKFLQFHREDTTEPKNIGAQLTLDIYVHILEDAQTDHQFFDSIFRRS